MDPLDDAVVRHYEAIEEENRIAHGFSQLELLRVQEVLRRHLPDPPARVLDLGGATGIHARWLAEDGYDVRIIDITPRHVERANAELATLGVVAEVGDARRLNVANDSFDVVLMFGPLYHLTEETDRRQALAEAGRVLRPGGRLLAMAVCRFASLLDGLYQGWLDDPQFRPILDQDLVDGQHRNPDPAGRPEFFTTARIIENSIRRNIGRWLRGRNQETC